MVERFEGGRAPFVLIVDDQEWSARSIESILVTNGFTAARAYTLRKGLERARAHVPDLIIVDRNLPDGDGTEFARALAGEAMFATTPMLLTSAERLSRQERLAVLDAGFWDVLGFPIDGEELLLRVANWIRSKQESDRLRHECLVDDLTGLYTFRGLETRARELTSYSARRHEPLACVVIAPVTDDPDHQEAVQALTRQLADAFRRTGRTSDAIGRLSNAEFAVLAPSTSAQGAVRLAERLAEAARKGPEAAALEFQAGYDAVDDPRDRPVEAMSLLVNATVALRRSRASGNGWIQPFRMNGSEAPNPS